MDEGGVGDLETLVGAWKPGSDHPQDALRREIVEDLEDGGEEEEGKENRSQDDGCHPLDLREDRVGAFDHISGSWWPLSEQSSAEERAEAVGGGAGEAHGHRHR